MAQCKGKRGELWYHSIIHYNVKHFKGSYGRPESHISSILDYQFCACVMRISGVPQLQVIHMYDGWFTIALLVLGFGQVWAKHVCHDVMPKLRLSARFNIEKYTRYHTTL